MLVLSIIFIILSCSTTLFAVDPCRFVHPEEGVIDLTTLGHTDGTAKYADRDPGGFDNFVYSYNPCKPFTETPACQNVAACQIAKDGAYVFTLGIQESIQWKAAGELSTVPTAVYEYGGKTTLVFLQCSTNESHHFETLGEGPKNIFSFRLTHKCACWNGCSDTPSTTTAIVPTTTSQAETDACRFVHPEKGIIDLSFIGRTDEKAAYSDEVTRTTSNFKYSYNPCRSFSQGSSCIGAAVCQVSYDGQETFILGTQESAWWDTASDANGVASLNYVYGDKKVSISLQCSPEGNNEFEAYGENPVNTFRFQLTHKCACWNAC